MNKQSKIMLAVDGGGTKTEFLLFDDNGNVYKRLCLGGSNPNSFGIPAAIAVLDEGIKTMLLENRSISSVYFGVSGCGAPENKNAIQNYFVNAYPDTEFIVEPDIYNIVYSCIPSDTYVSVICGTGSLVCAVTKNGIERLGGYGYLFDRAICGYTLGNEAIYLALRAEDGLQNKSELTNLLQKHFGGNVRNKINQIYTMGKDYIADMAKFVFEAYDRGDKTAEAIINESICELAYLVNSCFSMYDTQRIVTLSGGLTKRHDVLIPFFEKYCKDTKFIVADMPQIYGAALYCCSIFSTAGIDFKDRLKQNIIAG